MAAEARKAGLTSSTAAREAVSTLRPERTPATVVDALKALAPESVIVDRVEFVDGSDQRFLIAGRADRNATVSNYLRALDTSEGFHKTELLQIMLDANGRPSFEIMLERKPDADVERRSAATPAEPSAPRTASSTLCQISSASCSTSPGAGKCWRNSRVARPSVDPAVSMTREVVPVVP